MKCEHDLAEMDLAVTDGFCPLCLHDRIEHKNKEIQRLQKQVKERGERMEQMYEWLSEVDEANASADEWFNEDGTAK